MEPFYTSRVGSSGFDCISYPRGPLEARRFRSWNHHFQGLWLLVLGSVHNIVGVKTKIGVFPPKWMVKIRENPMNKWMIWGENPLFLVQHPCVSGDLQLAVVTLTTGRGLIAWQTAVDRHGKHSCRFNVWSPHIRKYNNTCFIRVAISEDPSSKRQNHTKPA